MISASAGTICTTSTVTTNAMRPRNRKREMATAARKAIDQREPTTMIAVTIRLFRIAVQKKSRSNTLR